MRPFKFFGNKQEYIETIPSPVEVTINCAIITSRVTTFVDFRNDMIYGRTDFDYDTLFFTFNRGNICYHCVRTLEDIRGRHFDNFILLHDAHEMNTFGELDYIVANLQRYGADMF